MEQKVCLKTLGCKVNQYETQGIREDFLKAGYQEVEGSADLYIINTCTVTAEADREARALIRSCRRENPKAKIVVTGCYAQKDEKEILALDGVTHLVKQHDKSRVRQIVEGEAVSAPGQPRYLPLTISDFKEHTRAFVKVQDGCDYRCSFCKVWVVRGRSVSRPPSEIVEEVRRLCDRGFREVVLTGVSLGLYGRDLAVDLDIMELVHRLETVEPLERIRLSSIDPIDVGDLFIQKLLESRKCCKHLHLSLQSGDDEVLARMHRNYTSGEYRSIVYSLREKFPDFSITTDVIIGFPGETEAQFENTLRLAEELRFTRTHLFPYSPRKGTVAYPFKDLVSPNVLRARMKRIEKVTRHASYRYRLPLIGKELLVLVESPAVGEFLSGYTESYVRVLFKGEKEWAGKMALVRIEEVTPRQTVGILCYTI